MKLQEKANSLIKPVEGYKTKSAALAYLLVVAFGSFIPVIKDNEQTTINILNVLIASGLLHDVWRNRKKALNFIKDLFNKKY